MLIHGLDCCLRFFSEQGQIAFGHEAVPLPRRQLVDRCASFEIIKHCGNQSISFVEQLPKRKIRLMFASISLLHDLRDRVKNARTGGVQCTCLQGSQLLPIRFRDSSHGSQRTDVLGER
jgi:hypothetical protein